MTAQPTPEAHAWQPLSPAHPRPDPEHEARTVQAIARALRDAAVTLFGLRAARLRNRDRGGEDQSEGQVKAHLAHRNLISTFVLWRGSSGRSGG